MKYIKYLLIIILIFSFAMVSCKKDSTTGPSSGGSVVGTWNVVDAVIGWLLTTNSDQVATNIFDVTGQINISGAHTVTLNSMWMDDSTDPPSFTITSYDQDYFLELDGTTGEGRLIISNLTTYNDQTFIGNVTFTFDGTTLTITQSTIKDVASDATVTISGSLSFIFNNTDILANTPTLIQFPDYFYDGDENGSTTVEFRNDGTATVTYVYEGGTDIENWIYTTGGNQLIITDEFGYSENYEYSVTSNTMTWILTDFIDVCSDYAIQTECLADMEKEFNLTAGSLTNISVTMEIVFSKSAAKQGLYVGRKYNLINPKKVITDYKLKIDQLKKSL